MCLPWRKCITIEIPRKSIFSYPNVIYSYGLMCVRSVGFVNLTLFYQRRCVEINNSRRCTKMKRSSEISKNPNKLSRGFCYCLIWHLPLSFEFKFTQEVQQIMNPNQHIFDFMFSAHLFIILFLFVWFTNGRRKKNIHLADLDVFNILQTNIFIYVNIQSRAITHTTFQNVNTYLMVAAMSKDKQTHTHTHTCTYITYAVPGAKNQNSIVILVAVLCFLRANSCTFLQWKIIIHVNAASHCVWTLRAYKRPNRKQPTKQLTTAKNSSIWLHEIRRFNTF